MLTDIINVLINLVAHNDDALMTAEHLGQGFELIGAVHRPGRVARRAENQEARAGRDGGFQLFRGYLEVLLDAGLDNHGSALGQQDHLGVAHPVGGGDDDFVARIHERHNRVAHALLGAVRADDLGRRVVQPVLTFELVDDGLAQRGITGDGGIARIVLVDGFLGGFLDVVGRVEIGLAHGEVDDVYALCFKLATLLRHRQCGGRRQAVQAF